MDKMRLLIALVVGCALAFSTASFAQTRTTPVEVQNSPVVKVDTTQNRVKAEQYGPWQVEIVGTPGVSVSNSPTVKIDSNTNTVSAPTLSSGVRLFAGATPIVMAAPSTLSSVSFDCKGYREVRVVIKFSTSAPHDQFRIFPEYSSTPGGGTFSPGYVTGQVPTNPIVQYANFVQSSGVCVFTLPVLSERMYLLLYNASTTNTVSVDSDRSWVWLVN
jgi:hypothetical protein